MFEYLLVWLVFKNFVVILYNQETELEELFKTFDDLQTKYDFECREREVRKYFTYLFFNKFQTKAWFLYPLKMSGNLWFSGGKEIRHKLKWVKYCI